MHKRSLFHAVYDTLFQSKDYSSEIARVLGVCGCSDGRKLSILDLGAGTGNHAAVCARLNHQVTAVDVDPLMCELLRAKLSAEAGLADRISSHEGPVYSLPAARFDLCYALFNVINYVGDCGQMSRVFDAVAHRLAPGSCFIVDAWNGQAVVKDPPRPKTVSGRDQRYDVTAFLDCRTDVDAHTTVLRYTIEAVLLETGATLKDTFEIRHTLWTMDQICRIAAQAGFDIAVHPLNDMTRSATADDWKVLYICTKRA